MAISHEDMTDMHTYMYTHCQCMQGRLTDLLCLYLYGVFAGIANPLGVTSQGGACRVHFKST